MELPVDRVDGALAGLNLGRVVSLAEMVGGNSPVFKVDLLSGNSVVLKLYLNENAGAPERDAFAATLLRDTGIPSRAICLSMEQVISSNVALQ